MTKTERHRSVKNKAGLFGNDDIGQSQMTEPGYKIYCSIEICSAG
jgi:hypothetical protein